MKRIIFIAIAIIQLSACRQKKTDEETVTTNSAVSDTQVALTHAQLKNAGILTGK